MLISIVIPLYNKEKYIIRAIDSVLAQTYTEFELIVVDDGSTDRSVDLVKKVEDPRVKLISQKNGGVSLARNVGVKNASSDWVAFLDADDEYEPVFIQETVSFIAEHKDSGLSFVGANYFLGSRECKAVSEAYKSGVYDYFTLFGNKRSPNSSSTTIVNKAIFIEVGGFPEGVKNFEDWTTWFKLACAGNFGYISKGLGMYHEVEDSVSRVTQYSTDFFNYSILVPETVNAYIKKYSFNNARIKIAQACIGEFCLNMAITFAKEGEKMAALKMIRYTRPSHFFNLTNKKKQKLLSHLFVPQTFKRFCRKLKY